MQVARRGMEAAGVRSWENTTCAAERPRGQTEHVDELDENSCRAGLPDGAP
jgi:hypothetical protein